MAESVKQIATALPHTEFQYCGNYPNWSVESLFSYQANPASQRWADLAGVTVGEVLLGIVWGDGRQQESPALLANAVMVVWPVGWKCLHSKAQPPSKASHPRNSTTARVAAGFDVGSLWNCRRKSQYAPPAGRGQ